VWIMPYTINDWQWPNCCVLFVQRIPDMRIVTIDQGLDILGVPKFWTGCSEAGRPARWNLYSSQ